MGNPVSLQPKMDEKHVLTEDFVKSPMSWPWWDCVEVAKTGGNILVRDSKNPTGATLTFTESEWTAFIGGVKALQFELS